MTDPKKFIELKKQVESLRNAKERHAGSAQSYLDILKTEYKCDSIEQAKTLLNELNTRKDKLNAKAEERLVRIESKLRAATGAGQEND